MDILVIAASSVTHANTRIWPIYWTAVIQMKSFGQFEAKSTEILQVYLILRATLVCPAQMLSLKTEKNKEEHPALLYLYRLYVSECVSNGSLSPVSKPLDLLQSFKANVNDKIWTARLRECLHSDCSSRRHNHCPFHCHVATSALLQQVCPILVVEAAGSKSFSLTQITASPLTLIRHCA